MKRGKPKLVNLKIMALIGLSFVILLALCSDGNDQTVSAEGPSGEEHTITTSVRWNDTTVFAKSINIKAGGSLTIENVSIVMNNTGSAPIFMNNGTLVMNGCELIPMDFGAKNRYLFISHGACELNENEIFEPQGLEFFTNSVLLRGNTIFDSLKDSIHVTGEIPQGEETPTFIDNTILDSGQGGFRFEDVVATVSGDRILGAENDGVIVKRSKVTMTDCLLEDILGSKVSIGEDSVLQIHPTTNISAEDIQFTDKTSVVRIWTDDEFTIINPPEDTTTSDSFLEENSMILLIIAVVLAMIVLTLIFDRRYDLRGAGRTDTTGLTNDSTPIGEGKPEEQAEAKGERLEEGEEDEGEEDQKISSERMDDGTTSEEELKSGSERMDDGSRSEEELKIVSEKMDDGTTSGEGLKIVSERMGDGTTSGEGEWKERGEEGKLRENAEEWEAGDSADVGNETEEETDGSEPTSPSKEPTVVPGGQYDFELALRKLETLHRDRLLSDDEYLEKRKEIMDRPW